MEEVIEILQEVKQHITQSSDMMWTCFETPGELQEELDLWIVELKKGNKNVLESIDTHFSPAFTFQEHALQNDWTEAYHVLALRFDRVYKVLKGI